MAGGDRHSDPATAAVVIIIQHSIALFCGHCHGNRVADIGQRQDVRRAGAGKQCTGVVSTRQRIAVGRGQGEGHRLPRGNGYGLGLRCKRRRGFQNDAALRRGLGSGRRTGRQQHSDQQQRKQAAQRKVTPFVTIYYYTEKTPESKSPGSDEEKAVTMK